MPVLLVLLLAACSERESEVRFNVVRYVFNAVSPAVSSVLKLEGAERDAAVAKLIERGRKDGFPLVEKDSLFPDYVFATFFFTDTARRHEVELEVFGIYDEYRLGDRRLYRLDSTGLYYRSYLFPDDLCLAYRFVLRDTVRGKERMVSDPLNGNLSPTGERRDFSWSVLDMRPQEPDWYSKRYGDAGSRLDTLRVASGMLDNVRNVYVYTPEGYDDTDRKYPVIYLFDSFIYLNRVEVPNVLDNLIREKRLEPMVAVFIDNPTGTSRQTELPMNPLFRDFMLTELIPEVKGRYRITDRPDKTVVGGISYGGLAAAYLAFECNSVFGGVLSQSGGFWRDLELKDAGGAEYMGDLMVNRYGREKKRSIKLFLDWGLQENMVLASNRKFVGTLERRGYDFRFMEFDGWHCWSNSRKTFPQGLLYLTGRDAD